MLIREKIMTDDFSTVDIWVGSFPSKVLFVRYFDEQYADDDAPINQFAADQGVMFYDHDFCEIEFKGYHVESFDALIDGHSFWKSYTDEAKKAFLASDHHEKANVIVLVWGRKISRPHSVDGENFRLSYLGRFSCDPSSS